MNVIFFGSTADSVLVLEKIFQFQISNFKFQIVAVVTQPPRPVGRSQTVTRTPVQTWANDHNVPVLVFPNHPDRPYLFADEERVVDTLQPLKADLLVSACYGQKIPWESIHAARFGGLNVHPSLLPRWRGADPVPWAILSGDRQTGVTVVTLSETFDEGTVIAQKKIPITDTDTSDPLRTKLFTLGAELLIEALPECLSENTSLRAPQRGARQSHTKSEIASSRTPRNDNEPYARRLTRQDGFEPWDAIQKAFEDPEEARRIDRKFRAFHPWPGLWTLLRQGYGGQAKEKRLKILSCHLSAHPIVPSPHLPILVIDTVQLEGKKPTSWKQFQEAYLPS